MAKGHVERLKSGYRAKVYAGIDPISKKQIYLNGEIRETEEEAVADTAQLLKQAKSRRSPDRSATVAHLLDEWMETADHELSTAVTNRGYIEQKLKPTIGEYTVRQFQDRVDVLDELYNHLRKCSKLCHGKPMVDQARRSAALAAFGLMLKPGALVFSPARRLCPVEPGHLHSPLRTPRAEGWRREVLKNLRHFNATELLCAGVDVATVADRLGHANGGVTTLRFYASGTCTADQRAAEQLSRNLQVHRNGSETNPDETAAPTRNADRRRKRRVLMAREEARYAE
jgi:hypothetical protein